MVRKEVIGADDLERPIDRHESFSSSSPDPVQTYKQVIRDLDAAKSALRDLGVGGLEPLGLPTAPAESEAMYVPLLETLRLVHCDARARCFTLLEGLHATRKRIDALEKDILNLFNKQSKLQRRIHSLEHATNFTKKTAIELHNARSAMQVITEQLGSAQAAKETTRASLFTEAEQLETSIKSIAHSVNEQVSAVRAECQSIIDSHQRIHAPHSLASPRMAKSFFLKPLGKTEDQPLTLDDVLAWHKGYDLPLKNPCIPPVKNSISMKMIAQAGLDMDNFLDQIPAKNTVPQKPVSPAYYQRIDFGTGIR